MDAEKIVHYACDECLELVKQITDAKEVRPVGWRREKGEKRPVCCACKKKRPAVWVVVGAP